MEIYDKWQAQTRPYECLIESGSIQKNNQKKHEDDDLLYTLLDLEPLLATLASISRTYLSTYVHIAVESREEKRDSVTSAFIHSPLNQQQIKKMPMKKNFCLQTQYLWMTKTN